MAMARKNNSNNSFSIDYKLDYMARLFKKISHKRFECYVIQRIWHRLDDDRLKFVAQQYIRRNKINNKYALADLYIPQVNIIIEVNEAYHYASERKKGIDRVRNAEISQIANATVIVVDCTKPLLEIHAQIESIIYIIKEKVKELESIGRFEPWYDGAMLVEYYKRKGVVKVEDNVSFRTIDDICKIFGTSTKSHSAGASLPGRTDYKLWFPSTSNSGGWNNKLINDDTIEEYNKDGVKNQKHYIGIINEYIHQSCHKRVTFLKYKDDLGFDLYRFVGVFKLDYSNSVKENRTVWKKDRDTFPII